MSSQVRTRRWISAGVLFGLIGSIATHGSIILAMLFLFLRGGGTGSTGTNGNGGGEDGHEGAGDTSIDVTLASPATTAEAQPTAAPTPPTPIVPPPTPPVVQEKADPDDIKELPPLPKEIPPLPTKPESATGKDATTNGGKSPGPTRIGMPGGNGAGSGSGKGFGADSIEGQRAILPKAASCKDPIAGSWEAFKYNPFDQTWVHFKLTMHREGTAVHGTIVSRIWSGSPRDRTPPGCDFGGFDVTTGMNGSGTTNGINVTFGASQYTIVAQCGFRGQYFPDRFSGSLDDVRQEFQSLNNDGNADINVPYVFRRTGCIDE